MKKLSISINNIHSATFVLFLFATIFCHGTEQTKTKELKSATRVSSYKVLTGHNLNLDLDSLLEKRAETLRVYHAGGKFNCITSDNEFWIPFIEKDHAGIIILEDEGSNYFVFRLETSPNKNSSLTVDTLDAPKWVQDSIVNITTQHVVNITCKDSSDSPLKACMIERIKRTQTTEYLHLKKATGLQFTATEQDSCMVISKKGYRPLRLYFNQQGQTSHVPMLTDLHVLLADSTRTNTSRIKHKSVFLFHPEKTIHLKQIVNH